MRYTQEFIRSLNVSGILKSKFLYAYAILLTPTFVLNVLPIHKSRTEDIVFAFYILMTTVLAILALFKLAPRFTRALQTPGDIQLPGNGARRIASKSILLVFFIWVAGCVDVITYWVSPHLLNAETLKPGIAMSVGSMIAGPMEETWRWALILTLFFVGSKCLKNVRQPILFWASVGISCMLFGVGHIGQLKGHAFVTWFVLSFMGLLFFLFAYIARSFWVAVLAHSLYDAVGAIFGNSLLSWWPYLAILWIIVGFFYYRWHKTQSTIESINQPVEVSQ